MAEKTQLFTVGHSNHDAIYFLELLQSQDINCIVDVRSTPASSYNPQFNRQPLSAFLKREGIAYLHFGEEFGARHENAELLSETGQLDFKKFQATAVFLRGVQRLRKGLEKGFRIALMCSEADPLACHRFSMIASFLVEREGLEVLHILKDKTLKSHQNMEKVLLERFKKKLPQPNLFNPKLGEKERLEAAYRLHNEEIGWNPAKNETEKI